MRAPVISVVLLLLASSGVIAGDDRWWQDPAMQLRLHLTPAQVSRIDQIFESDRPTRIARRRELARLEASFRLALRANDLDRIDREHLIDRIEGIRSRINVRRTMMLVEILRELSPTQRQELSALKLQMRE